MADFFEPKFWAVKYFPGDYWGLTETTLEALGATRRSKRNQRRKRRLERFRLRPIVDPPVVRENEDEMIMQTVKEFLRLAA